MQNRIKCCCARPPPERNQAYCPVHISSANSGTELPKSLKGEVARPPVAAESRNIELMHAVATRVRGSMNTREAGPENFEA